MEIGHRSLVAVVVGRAVAAGAAVIEVGLMKAADYWLAEVVAQGCVV